MTDLPRPPSGNQNRDVELLTVFWVEYSMALMIVASRLYTRKRSGAFGQDDAVLIVAWVFYSFSLTIDSLYVVKGGTHHLFYLDAYHVSTVLKTNWIAAPFVIMTLSLVKTSVALFAKRFLGPDMKWRYRFLWVNIFLINLVTVLACIFSFIQCNPPRALWMDVPGAHCWNPKYLSRFLMFISGHNTFLDIALALLPMHIIWKLNMKPEKKKGLYALLSVGMFASIASGIKTSKMRELNGRADLTWNTFNLKAWTASELFALFVCSSVPAMKPFYQHVFLHQPWPESRKKKKKKIRRVKIIGEPHEMESNRTPDASPRTQTESSNNNSYDEIVMHDPFDEEAV